MDGDKSRYAGPEHRRCNRATAGRSRFTLELEPERPGLDAGDRRWQVPWLEDLRDVPADATWPRLMTVPHPRAVGSLGDEFAVWAEARSEKPLRWWQRLVATRALEVDDAGELVWESVLLTMARQLGKSWLLREMLLWRIHQGERFGEPQTVVHIAMNLAVVKEVQRDARLWAAHDPGRYRVVQTNGQEYIERREDGSRWILRARTGTYGFSANLAAVDEVWKVDSEAVDDGLAPTMVERAQSQLWLVSTAHRLATPLMLRERRVALDDLEAAENSVLLVEWSAPEQCELDDEQAWRLASPHWTPKRQRLISRRLEAAQANEVIDATEPDAVAAFRAQWLNQWPRMPMTTGESLLPEGLWDQLAGHVDGDGPLWIGLEDDFGLGAAVGAASRLDDGRIEVAGWRFDDWDQAVDWAHLLGWRKVRQVLVGASMLDRMPPGTSPTPEPAAAAQTRVALAVFRDLAMNGQLVHEPDTKDLDHALGQAKVRELPTGLSLQAHGQAHVVKAAAWAVAAAHRPVPSPGVW